MTLLCLGLPDAGHEVYVSRGKIAQALVIAAMVVVVDEPVDLGIEAATNRRQSDYARR